jgi:ABC-2 type transport system permease protein
MSTIAVAKKDFRDGIRSRSLIVLVILFTLLIVLSVYFFVEIIPSLSGQNTNGSESDFGIFSLVTPTSILLPIVGVLIGYKAIVGERTSGSLKFLLGLPHTRRDVVFGKLLGRSGVVTVAVLIGFAVGGIALYSFTSAVPIAEFVMFTAVTILLGVTFVSIAIAFSSVTRSSALATAGAITLVLLFLFLWDVFLLLVNYAAEQLGLVEPAAGFPTWYFFLSSLNPATSYGSAVVALTDAGIGIEQLSQLSNPPFYLQNWFGFVILSFWLVVPIGLAYIRFQRSDL